MQRLRNIRHRNKDRGVVLLLAVVVLTVLLVLGASLIEQAQHAVYREAIEGRSAQSFQLAEAGINQALWALSQDGGWTSYDGEEGTEVDLGYFDVSASPPASVRDEGDLVRITATGYLPGPEGAQRLPRQVQVVVAYLEPHPFAYGLAGDLSVDVGNSVIDSYRSDEGPYGGANVRANAHIGTNAISYSANKKNGVMAGVRVASNGVLNGDILVGPGADPADVTDVQGTHTGSSGALPEPIAFAPAEVPDDAIDLGAVLLAGSETLTLSDGVYRADEISITGATASIVITGDVEIYVSGNIYVAGNGIANAHPGRPRNLRIYGMETTTSVEIKGASTFYGLVYAPSAEVIAQGSTQSGEIFGALVGKKVKLEGNNTRFHYDETLAENGGRAGVLLNSWQVL